MYPILVLPMYNKFSCELLTLNEALTSELIFFSYFFSKLSIFLVKPLIRIFIYRTFL